MDKPVVVITTMHRWSYFQWFILGLYEQEKLGNIKLKIKVPFLTQLLRLPCNTKGFIGKALRYTQANLEKDTYLLKGYVKYPDSTIKYFAIDPMDAPYFYEKQALDKSSVYFKMQCPIDLDAKAFELTSEVSIPWSYFDVYNKQGSKTIQKGIDNFSQYQNKIKPLMIGPRQLSKGMSYKALKKGYDNYFSSQKVRKSKDIMCYFGNALGPKKIEGNYCLDLNSERQLMGHFGSKLNHPNEKRKIVSDLLKEQGQTCDARVICDSFSDNSKASKGDEPIPLVDFCDHISSFKYNFNVSGYRMSIPNRFIESFIVGTGIITDKLMVKWYLPFENNSVVETAKMGYLPMAEVDWDKVEYDIKNIPSLDAQKVIDEFNNKWCPIKVAKYILDTIKNS